MITNAFIKVALIKVDSKYRVASKDKDSDKEHISYIFERIEQTLNCDFELLILRKNSERTKHSE